MLGFVLAYGFLKGVKFLLLPFLIIPIVGTIGVLFLDLSNEKTVYSMAIFLVIGISTTFFEQHFARKRKTFLESKLSIYFNSFPNEMNKTDLLFYQITFLPGFILMTLLTYVGLKIIQLPINNLFLFSILISLLSNFLYSLNNYISLPQFSVNGTQPPKEKYQNIHAYAHNGDLQKLKTELQNGANINQITNKNMAPIHISVESQNFEVTQYLIQSGADIHLPGGDFVPKTPLLLAIIQNDIETIKLLLSAGADFMIEDSQGYNVLWYAIYYAKTSVAIFDLFIDLGANPNLKPKYDDSLLVTAAELKDSSYNPHPLSLTFVEKLLALGLNPDGAVNDKTFPIIAAIKMSNTDVVELLIQHHANPNKQSIYYATALQTAICHHHLKLVDFLIKNGADLYQKGGCGVTKKDELETPLRQAYKVQSQMFSDSDKKEMEKIIEILRFHGA